MKNINKVTRAIELVKTKFFYGKKFKNIGKRSILFSPLQIDNPQGIGLGNYVFVGHNAWLIGSTDVNKKGLYIDDNVIVGHFAHLVAMKSVVIGKNVLLADKVFISDCTHSFEDIDRPVHQQEVRVIKKISIGEGSWLGENVCVCGASIGKHCVIGANSVVIKDIPDYSVAAGIPAKVIKRYNFTTEKWEKALEKELL